MKAPVMAGIAAAVVALGAAGTAQAQYGSDFSVQRGRTGFSTGWRLNGRGNFENYVHWRRGNRSGGFSNGYFYNGGRNYRGSLYYNTPRYRYSSSYRFGRGYFYNSYHYRRR